MNRRFVHYLKIVAAVHVLLIVVAVVVSGWRRLLRPKPTVSIPVEFVMDAPPVAEVDPVPEPAVPEPAVPEPPVPDPPAPEPPVPERKPIERSSKRVTRTVTPPAPRRKTLDSDEVRKLLARGIDLSDHARVPETDRRLLERIRRVLYETWAQPSKEEAGDRVVRARITLGPGGRITGRRLVSPSGNRVLDASVMKALQAVTRVEGVTADFLARHSTVTIAFKVE